MSVSVPYLIDLTGLRGQAAERHYELGDDFFAAIEGSQIDGGDVKADVTVTPHAGDAFSLDIRLEGTVRVSCDRCLEPVDVSIAGRDTIKVVLGAEDGDDGEVVTVDETRGTLDVAWHIYELAALLLPLTHVHPEGQCDEAMAGLLGTLAVEAPDIEE